MKHSICARRGITYYVNIIFISSITQDIQRQKQQILPQNNFFVLLDIPGIQIVIYLNYVIIITN